MKVACCGNSHIVCHQFCFIHNTVDSLCSVVKQLCGVVDGRMLDVEFTMIEEEVEKHNEEQRNDNYDKHAQAYRQALPNVKDNLFHRAVEIISWSSNRVIVSEACMMSIWRRAISAFVSLE